MLNKVILFFFLFGYSILFSQSEKWRLDKSLDSIPSPNQEVATYVERMPEFQGGETALMKFIIANINYPQLALDSGIVGKVIVQFVVSIEGDVTNAKIIRGIGFGCDEEVLRMVYTMPKWKPGMQNGKLVNVAYNLPVKFSLK